MSIDIRHIFLDMADIYVIKRLYTSVCFGYFYYAYRDAETNCKRKRFDMLSFAHIQEHSLKGSDGIWSTL